MASFMENMEKLRGVSFVSLMDGRSKEMAQILDVQ